MKVKAFVLVVLLLITGCTSKIDRHKFENVDRLTGLVEEAAENGTDYSKFEEAVNNLSAAISAMRGAATTKQESALLNDYAGLLRTYQDGQLLWRYRMESSLYPWVPKGRIYADENIKLLAAKYGFSMESSVVEITGHQFSTISSGSVNDVLEKARIQARGVRGGLPLF